MTPAELPAYLEQIKARVEAAAIPVVEAIGETYQEHLVGFTLHESGSHAPVTRTPAPEGRPPAFMPGGVNGSLAGSVIRTPATGGGGIAETAVGPTVIYAGVQEFGAVITKSPGYMALWIGYIGFAGVKARGWLKHRVKIPARPYLSTAVEETIADGSLVRAAMERFMAVVWGE